jgi:hypothetical protein
MTCRRQFILGCLLLSYCSMAMATDVTVVDPMASCRDVPVYFNSGLPPADALVTLTLSLEDDGTGARTPRRFAIYADVSGDNAGLAAFGMDLQGDIESLYNMSPQALYTRSGQSAKFAGFTVGGEDSLRGKIWGMPDMPRGSGLIPVYGLGREAGDMSASAPDGPKPEGFEYHDFNGNDGGPIYNGHLLLGVGSYGDLPPAWEICSIDNLAYVFRGGGGPEHYKAHIALRTIDFRTNAVPEPSSLAILSGCWPLVFRTRRPKRV